MALLTQLGLVPGWFIHADKLKRAADGFKTRGTDAGTMHVAVTGPSVNAGARTRRWHLVATQGDGPCVPTLAAAALIRKLRIGEGALVGARPCVGLLCLDDVVQESEGLHIEMTEASP